MNRHPLASATAMMTTAALLFSVMALSRQGRRRRGCPGPRSRSCASSSASVAVAVAATRIRLRPRNWRGLFWRGAFGGSRGALLLPGHRAPDRRHGHAAQLHGAGVRGAVGLAASRRAHRPAHARRARRHQSGVGVVIVGNAPPGGARARAAGSCVGIVLVGALGRGDRHHPRGAQDRRRVGDLHAPSASRRALHRRAGVAPLGGADRPRVAAARRRRRHQRGGAADDDARAARSAGGGGGRPLSADAGDDDGARATDVRRAAGRRWRSPARR